MYQPDIPPEHRGELAVAFDFDASKAKCPNCGQPVEEMRAEPIRHTFADSPYIHYTPSDAVLMLPCGCEIDRETKQCTNKT
jgi:hypothetical protein